MKSGALFIEAASGTRLLASAGWRLSSTAGRSASLLGAQNALGPRSTQLGHGIGNRVAMRGSACGEVVTSFIDCECFFSDCDSHLFS